MTEPKGVCVCQFLLLGRGENVLICTGDGFRQDVPVLLLFGRAREWLGSEGVIQVLEEPGRWELYFLGSAVMSTSASEATWKDSREPGAAVTRLWVWT